MTCQWPQAGSRLGASRRQYPAYCQGAQRRREPACGHPEGAPTRAHLRTFRLLKYAGYVCELTPSIWARVGALTLHYQSDEALATSSTAGTKAGVRARP